MLYQLAVGLLIDLGLNREPIYQETLQTALRLRLQTLPEGTADEVKHERTLEERRAFLGAFYLSTMSVICE